MERLLLATLRRERLHELQQDDEHLRSQVRFKRWLRSVSERNRSLW